MRTGLDVCLPLMLPPMSLRLLGFTLRLLGKEQKTCLNTKTLKAYYVLLATHFCRGRTAGDIGCLGRCL